MKLILKIMVGAVLVIGGILAVSYLQYRFDQADIRHALTALRQTRPLGPQGPTLEERILQVYGLQPGQVHWEPHIESKVQGTVEIRAEIPGNTNPLIWKVDLVRYHVVPISPQARELGKATTDQIQ